MGGVRISVALSVVLVCLWLPARAHATETLRSLAREKAAAVAILRTKGANEIATLAQGRLFSAYLNATTQGEGLRIKRRIEAALETIDKRFGLHEIMLIDRGGEVIACVATSTRAGTKFDIASSPVLKAAFASDLRKSSFLLTRKGGDPTLAHIAPVIWHGEKEFVLRAAQDFAVYRGVLARGVGANGFVVLADESGSILTDTRPTTIRPGAKKGALKLAGLSLDGVRAAVKGTKTVGGGEIGNSKERLAVAYQAVGGWVVVAVEPIAPPHRCPHDGDRLCG